MADGKLYHVEKGANMAEIPTGGQIEKATLHDVYQLQLQMHDRLGAISVHLATLNGRVGKTEDGMKSLMTCYDLLMATVHEHDVKLAVVCERDKYQGEMIKDGKEVVKEQGKDAKDIAKEVAKVARDVTLALTLATLALKVLGVY